MSRLVLDLHLNKRQAHLCEGSSGKLFKIVSEVRDESISDSILTAVLMDRQEIFLCYRLQELTNLTS